MFDEQPDGDIHGECAAEIKRLEAELAALKAQEPIGYIHKTDLARLQDEVTWDGSHLRIGVDHFSQWLEDTPYSHLAPIYAAPAQPHTPILVSNRAEIDEALDAIDERLNEAKPQNKEEPTHDA